MTCYTVHVMSLNSESKIVECPFRLCMTFILLHLKSISVQNTTKQTKGHKNSMRSPLKNFVFFFKPQETTYTYYVHLTRSIFFFFTCNGANVVRERFFSLNTNTTIVVSFYSQRYRKIIHVFNGNIHTRPCTLLFHYLAVWFLANNNRLTRCS